MFYFIIIILGIWELYWKYKALWLSARNNDRKWFIAILIINSLGILPIYYLYNQSSILNNQFDEIDSNNLIIDVIYIKGPLKNLQNQWKFEKIDKNNTKVHFKIQFEFKNIIYQKISETFFYLIENKMINSFKKRADEILN